MDESERLFIEKFLKRWQDEGDTANQAKARFAYSIMRHMIGVGSRETLQERMASGFDLIDKVYAERTH
jgi:queuine/archaeosine tRNA-ribosyltransferase